MSVSSLDVPTLDQPIAAAVTAASLHNIRPWRFRLGPKTRTVRSAPAPDRGLRHTDRQDAPWTCRWAPAAANLPAFCPQCGAAYLHRWYQVDGPRLRFDFCGAVWRPVGQGYGAAS